MITAVFTDGDDCVWAYGLWQWDYGQQLRIEGLHLPTVVEIHFSLQEAGGEAVPRVGVTKDGVTTVTIPDSMLEGAGAVRDYQVYAWVYLSDRTFGETTKQIMMKVKARSKPKAFEAPGDGEIFHEAIEAVNDAAKRAEDAGDKAVVAADEAEKAATQTAEHLQATEGLAEQVETNADTVAQDKQAVAGMLSQTQQAASDAALSAQAAKLSETAAVQAQTGAEAAEDGARQYAEETGADRQAVANDKQVVSQMREAVAADRQAVEQTAAQFGQTAQDALTAIGQAQSTAVGAVKAEGNKQTTAVQEAGTQAVSEVAEAKTTAVQAVTTEGDKQTKRVKDAAAGIVADREQIAANKQAIESKVDKQQGADNAGKALVVGKDGNVELGDAQTKTDPTLTQPGQAADAQVTGREIATLHQGKADAIVETAQGETVILTDSSDKLFEGLRVFGKSTQRTTTGAQLLSIKQEDVANKDGLSAKVNVDGGITVTGTPDKQYATIYGKDIILSPGKYYLNGGNGSAGAVLLKARITFSDGSSKNCANGSFEVTPDTKSVSILIQYESATIQSVNYTIYPMLNKGETALPFEPYTGGKPSPSPEYPQEIVSAGEGGSIAVGVTGKNLLKPNSYNTYYGFPLKANTVMTLMTNGKPSQGGNIKFSATDGSNVWFSIDAGQTRVCRSIGNKDVKGFYDQLKVGGGLEYMFAVGDIKTYEPYHEPQSLTLATPNGLPGVPVSKDGNYTDADGQQWVCDEIDLGRGKYVQRIEEHILKSKNITSITNSRQINSEYYGIEYNGCTKDFVGKFGNGVLCDKLAFVKPNSNINGHEITYVPGNGIIVFGLKKSLVPSGDLDEIRNYITSNNFAFLILIDSPIEKDLTPEEITEYKKTHTNYPTTVITNDAGAEMEATYVADTKAYIQNLEQRLSAKLVNIQSALISQKTSGGGHLTIADSSPLPVEEFGMTGKTEQRKMSGKNLFDINSLKKYEVDNNDLKTSVDNDKIVLEGKGVTTTEVIFFCLNKTDDLLKLNPGKYTLSFKSNMPMGTAHKSKTVEAFAIIKKADGSSDYSSTGNKGWTTFDIAEGDMMYFRFDINNGTMTAEFYDIQLEYGSSVTAYEPYTGGQPSPSPDYPQSIELADQPITVTIKGGTESQSIILTPPRPFTKWDKLEKVNGVWCWVYQHKVLSGTEMAKNSSGLHTSGALMVNVSGLGIAENQDNSVCNKLICPTKSVASLAYGEFRILYGNIYLKIDGVTTIEEGRQWLESNDIIIIAQASAPEYIPLTPSEQAQLNTLTMYAGTTEITNNGGCTMDLTYTADTKSYIDNKLAAISAAMIGGT